MDKFLSAQINICRILNPSQEWFAVDENLRFVGGSRGFLYSLHDAELIGKQITEFGENLLEFTIHYVAICKKIIKSNRYYFQFIRARRTKGHIILFKVRVTKIIEPESNIFKGIVNFINVIQFCPSTLNILQGKEFIEISNESNDEPSYIGVFNLREQIICWLISLNVPYKEIANALTDIEGKFFSVNEVSNLVSKNIYTKFNVHTNADLIIELYKYNLLASIPEVLFNYMSISSI